jgi:hypothetical protein
MHGPYHALVTIDGETVTLRPIDVREGEAIADRFYQGAGVAVLDGFTRAAVFTTALLLDPGQQADVEIVGRVGTEGSTRPCQASAVGGDHRYCSRCDGTGREIARDSVAKYERVRRDDRGRLVSSLGSRFTERIFKGV